MDVAVAIPVTVAISVAITISVAVTSRMVLHSVHHDCQIVELLLLIHGLDVRKLPLVKTASPDHEDCEVGNPR